VGAVVLASQASSSLIQPLFGLWSDRRGALWLLPGGVALGGAGIALAADAPSYWLVVLLVFASGIGSAAYHPEGSKFAGFVSGRKRASGMAWFSIGGNLGYALGPIATTALVAAFGLRGGLLLALPSLAVAVGFLAAMRYLRAFAPERGAAPPRAGANDPFAMKLLLGVIALRSVAWFGLITFVPLWEVSLGHSKSHGNHLLALMLFTGGVGTLALGPLAEAVADRYFAEFPDDLERYGEAARAWEIHDTCYCLQWAVLDTEGFADLEREVTWLTGVLGARGFPLEHLAANLELAGDVVAERLEGSARVARELRAAAGMVRRTPTFL
jgi:MFS family permease